MILSKQVPSLLPVSDGKSRLIQFQNTWSLILVFEYMHRIFQKADSVTLLVASTVTVVASVFLIAGCRRTINIAVLCSMSLYLLCRDFPASANHHYLVLISGFFFLLLRLEVREESQQLGTSLIVLVLASVFWAGVQKVVQGYYIHGTFLTYAIVHSPRFRVFFELLFGNAWVSEITQVVSQRGTYHSDSLSLLLLSNGIWIAEILLPLGVCWRRTRVVSLLALVLLIALIQGAAREVAFGIFVLAGLALGLPRWVGGSVYGATAVLLAFYGVFFSLYSSPLAVH